MITAIEYIEYPPVEGLKNYVKHLYVFNSKDLTPERILPLGTAEITVNLGESANEAFLVNPRTSSYFVIPNALNKTIGISFWPWGLYAMFGISPAEIANGKFHLKDILQPACRELIRQVEDKNAPREIIAILQKFLLRMIPNQPLDMVADAIRHIDRQYGQLNLADLYNRYPLSPRRLQQLFECTIGMSPKQYCRLKRFHFTVTRLQKDSSLTSLALDTGHYDQSHFIHEFNHFAGTTPSGLLKESNRLNAINARTWFNK